MINSIIFKGRNQLGNFHLVFNCKYFFNYRERI